MNGKSVFSARDAARAVLPTPEGPGGLKTKLKERVPSKRTVRRFVRADSLTCEMNGCDEGEDLPNEREARCDDGAVARAVIC
jgi:hypothetical protein